MTDQEPTRVWKLTKENDAGTVCDLFGLYWTAEAAMKDADDIGIDLPERRKTLEWERGEFEEDDPFYAAQYDDEYSLWVSLIHIAGERPNE